MIIEQYHSNHLIPVLALYNFWLPSFKDFWGVYPSTFFCDFFSNIYSFYQYSKKLSQVVCVSYHVILEHYLSNFFDTNFSFLELFVIEIVAVLLVYPFVCK